MKFNNTPALLALIHDRLGVLLNLPPEQVQMVRAQQGLLEASLDVSFLLRQYTYLYNNSAVVRSLIYFDPFTELGTLYAEVLNITGSVSVAPIQFINTRVEEVGVELTEARCDFGCVAAVLASVLTGVVITAIVVAYVIHRKTVAASAAAVAAEEAASHEPIEVQSRPTFDSVMMDPAPSASSPHLVSAPPGATAPMMEPAPLVTEESDVATYAAARQASRVDRSSNLAGSGGGDARPPPPPMTRRPPGRPPTTQWSRSRGSSVGSFHGVGANAAEGEAGGVFDDDVFSQQWDTR